MTKKSFIKKEITLFHFLMLTTSKLLVGAGVGLWIFHAGFPYTYPLIVIGAVILIPSLYFLFKKEKIKDEKLEKEFTEA